MSEHTKEPWMVSLDVPTRIDEVDQQDTMLSSVAMACNSGDRGKAIAKRIVADHNGCIGIESPETTVPELVAVCNKMLEGPVDVSLAGLTNEAAVAAGDILDWVHTLVLPVLAKTGKQDDPPQPQRP